MSGTAERCESVSAAYGHRCDRDAGHEGNHFADVGSAICAWGFTHGAERPERSEKPDA